MAGITWQVSHGKNEQITRMLESIKTYSHGRSYRAGRAGISNKSGEHREQRSRGHKKQRFHVYAIPGPQPVPFVPIVPIAPTPPPLPPFIITRTVTTTGRPPSPLISGGPAPIIIGGPAPLISGSPAPLISGAPAPLISGAPAPLSSPQATPANGALAQNIKCADEGGNQRLTATIRRPNGFSSQPVFNDASNINSLSDSNCRMTPLVSSNNQFLVEVANFKACGVKMQRQGADNKEWMALTVRFPFISGLRLAEDEYIMVLCRPQDQIKTQNHELDLRGNIARSPKSVFSSGPQNFQCDIALFRIGTTGSAEKITSGTAIEIGEKLQLRGEVRTGDGWKFARLTDVIVKRVVSSSSATPIVYATSVNGNVASDLFSKTIRRVQANGHGRKKRATVFQNTARIYGINQQSAPLSDIAFLVLSDGCRNPTFKAISPYHPWRDDKNPLAVNFLFRAFMFQNMKDGDSIRVTARVIACVRQQDCQYVNIISLLFKLPFFLTFCSHF
ncbi:hypothetical protein GQR58_021366 [Nymphon striatum]|nr:hypothetical protein GQR58_021366 [Nymphon striatum]